MPPSPEPPPLVIGPTPIRPNPFVSTVAEARALVQSISDSGLIPIGGTAPSSNNPLLIKPLVFQIRQARLSELYFQPSDRADYQSLGYEPYLLDFVASTIQDDSGNVLYSADPSNVPGSYFAGRRLPMGCTYYSEVVGILVDIMNASPNSKWYLNNDGSILRR